MARRGNRTPAARRPRPKPKARPQPKRRAAMRTRPPVVPSRSTGHHELWHPVMSSTTWVPESLKTTPLLRVRDYGNFVTGLITGAANPVVIILQPCLNNGLFILGQLGKFGAGATAGNAGTILASAQNATTAYNTGRARIHRMGVTVACLGPTAAGALLPTSFVRFGALRTIMQPNDYADFTAIAAWTATKSELHTKTAFELMHKAAHVCSFPVDKIEWQSLKQAQTTNVAAYSPDDSLAPIIIVLSTSATFDQYNVTVHVEYDYLPSDDAVTLAHSCAVVQPSLPMRIVDGAISAASSVAGVFEKGMQVAGQLGRLYSAVNQFTSPAPRPYPAIALRGVPALTM